MTPFQLVHQQIGLKKDFTGFVMHCVLIVILINMFRFK